MRVGPSTGHAHPGEPGRCHAGPMGDPWGPRHHRPHRLQPPGPLRRDRRGIQSRRDVSNARGAALRRGGRAHAGEAHHARARRDPAGETTPHLGEGGHRLSPLSPREDGRLPMSDFGGVHRYNVTGLVHDMWGFPSDNPAGRLRPDASPGGQDREPRERDHPDQGVLPGRCGGGPDLLRRACAVAPCTWWRTAGPGERGWDCWSSRPCGPSRPRPCARVAGRPSSWWWWR